MRRFLLLFFLAALTAGLLGCAVEDDPSRLTLWEQMDPAQQKILHGQLDRYMAAHPGIRVETNHFETEKLRTQFQTAALAGSGPDLVYGPSDQVGPFSIMGLIEPLETLFPPDTLALFTKASLATLDGHVYALADQVGNHLTLVYNEKYVQQPALDTEAWLAQLDSLTVDEDGDGKIDRYGVVMNLSEPFWLAPWLGGYGGWVMDDEGKPTLDTLAMTGALAFIRGLVKRGVVPASCDYPLADTLFKQGKAAYIINGPWSWHGYREAGIEIELALMPKVSATGLWPVPMTSAKCYSVNAYLDPATKECTAALLAWLTGYEVQVDMARTLSVLPSNLKAREIPEFRTDPEMLTSNAQIAKGRLMPIVPEMRAIWDSMRPGYQDVMNGNMTPSEAAAFMQKRAVTMIARMKDDMSGLAEKPRLLKPSNARQVGFEGAAMAKINGRYHLICAEFNKHPGYRTSFLTRLTLQYTEELTNHLNTIKEIEGWAPRVLGQAMLSTSYGSVGTAFIGVDPELEKKNSLFFQ